MAMRYKVTLLLQNGGARVAIIIWFPPILSKYSNTLYLSPASLPIAKFRVFLHSTKLRHAEHTELIPEVWLGPREEGILFRVPFKNFNKSSSAGPLTGTTFWYYPCDNYTRYPMTQDNIWFGWLQNWKIYLISI